MPKIAYAQMKVVAGHPDVNTRKILQLIDEARACGADMVIFPELAVPGRMVGGAWQQETFLDDCECYGAEIIAASKNITVVFGNIDIDVNDKPFNAIFVARNGKLIDSPVIGHELPSAEEKNSCAAPDTQAAYLHLENDTSDGAIEEYGASFLIGNQEQSVDRTSAFCLRLSSAPFVVGEKSATKNYGRPLISVSAVGVQNTGKTIYPFDGGSAVYNSRGELVQYAEPFAECLNFVELNEIDRMPVLKPPVETESARIYRAIRYGVKEFLEQIGVGKVVIGVSGGIDSAVAAALYVQVVGAENVYLVNMPSRFNSATTKNLSDRLAKNLGCKYFVVPIQESVDWTVKQLEGVGVSVSNFVKENIQARDRSARILAAVAASVGGVFTCNANKAESTVGYATLYGDEAGFLSALADLWKYQVYDLARYMNAEIYKREVIPQGIIDIVPSAELSTAQNVDEGKGDPLRYDYHDYLLRAFAENNWTPEEILRWYATGELEKSIGCNAGLVEKYFPNEEDFIADLERWWRAFTGMGVAKRIQSPPILAVTNSPYGARRESQNGTHFTRAYRELKAELIGGK